MNSELRVTLKSICIQIDKVETLRGTGLNNMEIKTNSLFFDMR